MEFELYNKCEHPLKIFHNFTCGYSNHIQSKTQKCNLDESYL